jgi:hypothetical protein
MPYLMAVLGYTKYIHASLCLEDFLAFFSTYTAAAATFAGAFTLGGLAGLPALTSVAGLTACFAGLKSATFLKRKTSRATLIRIDWIWATSQTHLISVRFSTVSSTYAMRATVTPASMIRVAPPVKISTTAICR